MIAEAKNTPVVRVGIFTRKEFEFTLKGEFRNKRSHQIFHAGSYKVSVSSDTILINGRYLDEIHLIPQDSESSFVLHKVTIGVDFHWQRNEDQEFDGELQILKVDQQLISINILPIDDYLNSVISSEMSATSYMELLKAHTIISRSWLLAQIDKNEAIQRDDHKYQSTVQTKDELIKWYDREDHDHFDVCADDHCQRYQGVTRVTTPFVKQAVEETKGLVLIYQGKICDARFSKCCGGVTELFENCWEPVNHPYLQSFRDADHSGIEFPDLTIEKKAKEWILSSPDSFCNTNNASVLKEVLNTYDQETNQFFRWNITYSQKEISELVHKKTGIDFGIITDFKPLERGASGRIIRLKIVGAKKVMVIGKELEIRKALSPTHLYSSAFTVEFNEAERRFDFIGAGWGHGVGLCQIGAAVMGSKGYSFDAILNHYFRGATIEKRY